MASLPRPGLALSEAGASLAERDKVVRVLSNLVSNALKYSDRGGHVELQVRATAGGSSSR